jgi:hypothetical protein
MDIDKTGGLLMTRMVTSFRSVSRGIRHVKALSELLAPQVVRDACRAAKYVWRDGMLNPVNTVHLFILQVLHGNTACEHLRHLSDLVFTASAYCQARSRLPLVVFENVLKTMTAGFISAADGPKSAAATWRGHRTLLMDGSSCSMPDTPQLQDHFGQPHGQKKGCGFPVAHLLVLFDAATGLLRELIAGPLRSGDVSESAKLHSKLKPGDLLIADRIFGGWGYVCRVLEQNLHIVVRAPSRLIIHFNARKRDHPTGVWTRIYHVPGSTRDQVIEWFKPKVRPKWIEPKEYDAMPPSIIVRVIRYRVIHKGFRTREVTLITTLVDHHLYPAEEIAGLYGRRWEVETDIRHLKRTMKMHTLKCQTVEGVMKELIIFSIVYNLVRMHMLAAAVTQKVNPLRISFIDAMRGLQRSCGISLSDQADHEQVKLIVNPLRPGRFEPRALKRRPIEQRLLTIPRAEARKLLLGNKKAA